jgi:hypothetical protein
MTGLVVKTLLRLSEGAAAAAASLSASVDQASRDVGIVMPHRSLDRTRRGRYDLGSGAPEVGRTVLMEVT